VYSARTSPVDRIRFSSRDLLQDKALSGEDRVLKRYLKPELLIVDNMGMKQLPKTGGEFLFGFPGGFPGTLTDYAPAGLPRPLAAPSLPFRLPPSTTFTAKSAKDGDLG
jgi:hypothetical protein